MVTGCTGYVICYNDVMHVCMTTRKHMHVHIFDAKAGHFLTYGCCFAVIHLALNGILNKQSNPQ